MQSTRPKVFGIGLNKTGTTSLGVCGEMLGLRCTSYNTRLLRALKKYGFSRELVDPIVENFDLFEDWPWPLIYQELDVAYPGSKFILTRRSSPRVWVESLKKHELGLAPYDFTDRMAYGYRFPQRREAYFIARYAKHNDDARAYFKGRSADFLEVSWEEGDGLAEVSAFLGLPKPRGVTPHANRAAEQERDAISRYHHVVNTVLSWTRL